VFYKGCKFNNPQLMRINLFFVMATPMMSTEQILSEIEIVAVDPEIVRGWGNEYPHLKLSTDLMGEAARYTCMLGSALAVGRTDWSVGEAILGGHLVRLFKLMRHAIQQVVDSHADILFVTIRLISEGIINFRYLQENRSDELFRSYLSQSLQKERDLLESIRANIADRGGKTIPIEERMLASIARAFANSQVKVEDLPLKRIRNWGGLNVRERAKALGLEEAYLGIFGGPSESIHGSWADLRQHQLKVVAPGRFMPQFEDERPRPQPFYSLTALLIPGLISHAHALGEATSAQIVERLEDLARRLHTADELHEEYL